MAFTTMNAGLNPSQSRVTLASNYLQWTDSGGSSATPPDFADFAQQYLPELYEQEVERFGNRTISGFLRMVGAEMPMTSDQVIWSEQNRLHISYDTATVSGDTFTITLPGTATQHALRNNNTIVAYDPITGLTLKGIVTDDGGTPGPVSNTFDAVCYTQANWGAIAGAANVRLFVYGSDFTKGVVGMTGGIDPVLTTFSNKPIIIKDQFEVSGSDTAQIGWVEIATEDGSSGFLWYLKAESETRLRYEDYLEMVQLEGELVDASTMGTAGQAISGGGTQGMFAALQDRGNVYSGFAGAAAPGAGALGDFDQILQQLDAQGAIEENMLFLDRATALDFDDMIGAQAGGGYAAASSVSYGLFDNSDEMALNFGFSGFRRGSYDFYKTDWKYLNDASTRGMVDNIKGVMIPAGTSTVYDQMLGQNIRRPFLHTRYRASETEDRRMKSWVTGSVGGVYTNDLDAMQIHYLSERCLCVQAANNFVLFTD
ncbi:hypothetical protein H8D85_00670 [bacterium]|nr:hypothetical protein [bacterium]